MEKKKIKTSVSPETEKSDKNSAGKKDDIHGKELTVIIAEDDENSSLFLSSLLENRFGKVILAKTGVEALTACQNNPDTDLIMMDVRMPEMNGYDSTRKIREFNQEVVIIAQTAYGIRGEIEKARALQVGCNDYLSKPIEIEILRGMIQKHLGIII